ncbi:uncharacterized protein PITG_18950 [Phytophthora infestans T30-4]|uniref:Uncharacterized protein n=2 Tax=Phytophthora infestans TaxID=4787 RepID=D0P027_PHYIT|nr:uncharacterized protein PITG_18950 [Phytophthora infestans T30-4]EEY70187.1 conserved hypothetical protein [Phytophthora infestans T30-4]KAF4038819.1 hypothetical protein GN244_ATG09037 [Phytophthora infestans]KAF4132543.1 hypothetical protein GN958_ATG18273 [Phytophthora infestans]KAI9991627.1 hypothetical protein PInf_016970 [Phytophthora infestans]|eukprot:XP_002997048.1 conserved hypothetical protein [Phytophthora infestans T30-4]
MSLATLQAVREQLSVAIEAAQRHLEVVSHDTSSPSPQEAVERSHTLAAEIESLEVELQTLVATIVTQTRHKHVAASAEAPQATTETIDLMDVETETEDEAAHANTEQEDAKQTRKPPPTPEEVAANLQHFVLKTGDASAALDRGQKYRKAQAAIVPCRKVTENLFQLMESKIPIDEASACLFRDTAGKMATIFAEGGRAGNNRDNVMCVVHLVSKLGKVLELADTLTGIPAALSDAVLGSTRLKLKKYAENHLEDQLTKMEKYVHTIQRQKGAVTAERIEGPMKKLIVDFQQEMNKYKNYQKIDLPPRSEERWEVFQKVAEALAKWIGCTKMTASPPRQLKGMLRVAKKFNKEFPDRVPIILLRNAGMKLRISQQQYRSTKEKASAK